MVAFNPEVPASPAPNFTSYLWAGKAIPTPSADESGKTRGEELGKAIKGVAETFDTFNKQNIDAKINAGVDQETNAYIKGLEGIKEQLGLGTPSEREQAQRLGYSDSTTNIASADTSQPVQPGQPSNAGTNSSPAGDSPKLLPPVPIGTAGTPTPPPAEVDQGIQQVQNLKTAQAQNTGKVSPFYYTGQILGLQQSLRQQYPGYREYIDGKLGNKANEYARELAEQINQAQAAKAKAAEHLHNTAITATVKQMESGDPSAAGWFSVLQANPDGSKDAAIMEQIRTSNEATWRFSRAVKESEGRKALGDIEADRYKQPTIGFINDTIANKWKEVSSNYGVISDEQFRAAALAASQDPSKVPQLLQMTQARQQALETTKAYLQQELNKPYRDEAGHQMFADGRGPTKTYSKDQLDQWTNEAMAPYQAVNKMVNEKDVPVALFTEELNKAVRSSTYNRYVNDPVWGNITRKAEFVHSIGMPPDVAGEFWRKNVWGPQAKGNMDYFMGMDLLNAMIGTKKTNGHYQTPSDWADQALGLGGDPKGLARNMSMILNTIPQVTDSKLDPRVKTNYYNHWFDLDNNILDDKYLQKDYRDDKGNWVPGKAYAYNKIMNPATLADVKKLDQTSEPGLWKKAGDWAVTNFRDKLASKEIGDLKDIDSTPWLKVTWNTEAHQFGITDLNGNPVNKQYKPLMQQSLARLNGYIKGIDNFAKVDGDFNVNAFILHTMGTTGEGASEKLLKALQTGGTKQIKGENDLEGRVKNKVASNDTSTLAYSGNDSTKSPFGSGTLADFKKFLDTGAGAAGAQFGLEDVAKRGVHTQNINPTFRSNMEKAIADYSDETGRKPEISSLFRTREEQARAYLNYLRGGGLAAPPGHSRHEIGEAADLNTDAKFANWLKSGNRASKYGMEFLPGHAGQIDPYHIQLNRRSAEK